ncbi:MAG: hypothetical protein Q7J73_03595 [Dehalococcoidales bacterium]|nr:hypothetical protein [Dehalococcoidales bacterium]
MNKNSTKKSSAVLILLFLLISSTFSIFPTVYTVPVYAAPQGNVTGTFGINAAPTINSVSLTPTNLTPQLQYTVSVSVSDPDTINDLSTLVLKLYYDANGTTNETEFNGISPSANAQNSAVITWTATAPGATTYTGSAALAPAGTTWSLGTSTLPQDAPGFELTTFTFQFVFTVGKVATQTVNPARWQVAVKATDSLGQTSFNKDAEGASMDFYGEINVPATTVNWGVLPPGTDFTATAAKKNLGVTVTYIANGAWDSKVSSGANWIGANNTAALDPTGATAIAQQFALKADNTATLGSAILVSTLGSLISNTGTQTLEAGTGVTNNTLWIRLSSSFIKDTYQGIITYIIANHV